MVGFLTLFLLTLDIFIKLLKLFSFIIQKRMYNIGMKKKPTKEESEMFVKLDELKKIDINKDGRKIVANPRSYFDKYLKVMDDKGKILAKTEIYLLIKKIEGDESSRERAQKDAVFFINRYTAGGYVEILHKFYSYALETIEEILSEGNNTMLDLYNEGKLSRQTLDSALLCMKEIEPMLLKDKEAVKEAVDQTEAEAKRINDMLNPGLQGFSNQPY